MTEFVDDHGAARQTLPIRAEVKSVAGVLIEGPLVEVDMSGLRLMTSRDLPVGTECMVTLVLEERPGHVRVPIRGEVSAADDRGMTIMVTETDEDRLEHLQDVVSYSLSAARQG